MKVLILLFFLLGCFPPSGGFVSLLSDESGATGPEDKYPEDTLAIILWTELFQNKTPVPLTDLASMNNLFARAGVNSQRTNGSMLANSFLEDGIDQTFMLSSSSLLGGKTVVFDQESAILKGFFDINLNEISPPETIEPGTVVLVGIKATENAAPSLRFENTYLLKLDGGNYVWYGNQLPLPNVSEAIEYGILDYFNDFEEATPETDYLKMNHLFAVESTASQTINGSQLTKSFMENGEDQDDMFTGSDSLYNKLVTFSIPTVQIKKFFTIDFAEINPPPPPAMMVPGIVVLVGIEARENGEGSGRFLNTYLLYIDGNKYVWLGNQVPMAP